MIEKDPKIIPIRFRVSHKKNKEINMFLQQRNWNKSAFIRKAIDNSMIDCNSCKNYKSEEICQHCCHNPFYTDRFI